VSTALPVILGVLLVALAAAAALLPLLRGAPALPATAPASDEADAERFELYRQVLELEFDQQTGKLSGEDFEALTRELLGRAGQLLHARQAELAEVEGEPAATTPSSDIDAEIEREIAAARKAFARARREQRQTEEVAS
jgi:cytochrome c-type biogenesis protein CcmI